MSNWFDDIKPVSKQVQRRERADVALGENPLFQPHPEGGGVYGGRDNALTAFVGLCRKKRLDIDAAVSWALSWNQEWCQPPLSDDAVKDKVGRAWLSWAEGDEPDAEPQPDVPKKIRFLSWEGMKQRVAELGSLSWLVDKVILRAGLTFISAPPGGGKSWAAADLVRASGDGGKWLGHLDVPKCKVMYIDEEMGVQGMFYRLDMLGVENPQLLYSDLEGIRLDDPLQVAEITDIIKREGVELVIVDTLVRVHRMDENDNSKMALLFHVFSKWRKVGASVVVLHHLKKGEGEGMGMMRGAGDLPAQADSCYSIKKGEDGIYTIRTEKSRFTGESEHLNLTYDICTEDGATTLRMVKIEAENGTEEKDLTRLILSALEKEPMSTSGVVEVVKRRKADVLEMLQQLHGEQLIELYAGIRGAKMWRIKSEEMEPMTWWNDIE